MPPHQPEASPTALRLCTAVDRFVDARSERRPRSLRNDVGDVPLATFRRATGQLCACVRIRVVSSVTWLYTERRSAMS